LAARSKSSEQRRHGFAICRCREDQPGSAHGLNAGCLVREPAQAGNPVEGGGVQADDRFAVIEAKARYPGIVFTNALAGCRPLAVHVRGGLGYAIVEPVNRPPAENLLSCQAAAEVGKPTRLGETISGIAL